MLSFAQFKALRRRSQDYPDRLDYGACGPSHPWEKLVISELRSDSGAVRYVVEIGAWSEESSDLESVEAILYGWAVSEGYFAMPSKGGRHGSEVQHGCE